MLTVGIILLVFFALIGVLAFLSALIGAGEDKKQVMVLEDLREENAEYRIRRAARRCERIRCGRLICRCEDAGAERICKILMKEYRMIELQKAAESD